MEVGHVGYKSNSTIGGDLLTGDYYLHPIYNEPSDNSINPAVRLCEGVLTSLCLQSQMQNL